MRTTLRLSGLRILLVVAAWMVANRCCAAGEEPTTAAAKASEASRAEGPIKVIF